MLLAGLLARGADAGPWDLEAPRDPDPTERVWVEGEIEEEPEREPASADREGEAALAPPSAPPEDECTARLREMLALRARLREP